MRRLAVLALVAVLAAPATAAGDDWTAVETEAASFLSEYIRIDTTNPPGNEIAAARFLAERFRAEGIEAKVFESEPGRGSVLARLPGTGKAKPIVLLNHLDVVATDAQRWQRDPLAGEIADGYVHGRGAVDCKGVAVTEAMAMILLKRQGVTLDRDVIFLGTADEEAGGSLGAKWFVEHHLDELGGAELMLNEGGEIRIEDGRRIYEVAVAEKTPCWLRLTAEGKAGHGSTPPAATAVTRLLAALGRVTAWDPGITITPEVQAYYSALAATEDEATAAKYRDLGNALKDDAFRAGFLADPRNAALVRNTITPTVLEGSHKTNVIPSQASADLDCRLLPGEDPDTFVARIREVLADDGIDVDVLLNFPPSASPTDTPLYRAIETIAAREQAPVVPTVLRGFTDAHYFRRKGIVVYGFLPIDLTPEDAGRMHGDDERIPTASLRDGVRRLADMLRALEPSAAD
jgi:acetylornithine deacetylase/succinyl-diaminopimelate desuccinylase-like protein